MYPPSQARLRAHVQISRSTGLCLFPGCCEVIGIQGRSWPDFSCRKAGYVSAVNLDWDRCACLSPVSAKSLIISCQIKSLWRQDSQSCQDMLGCFRGPSREAIYAEPVLPGADWHLRTYCDRSLPLADTVLLTHESDQAITMANSSARSSAAALRVEEESGQETEERITLLP